MFAQYIVQAAAEHLSGAFDAVTYVPVSPRRKFARGYDQAQLLARAAAKIWEVRAEQTLRKIRHNQAQSSLTRPEDRRENVKNAYAVPRPERILSNFLACTLKNHYTKPFQFLQAEQTTFFLKFCPKKQLSSLYSQLFCWAAPPATLWPSAPCGRGSSPTTT